jgi:hypothetical protein
MNMDAATKFLNDKRKEQKTKEKSMMLVIAPSMASRYGMDDMGGYSLQSGKYTGAGLDGAVEPDLPTERRQASNGQPYGVDEGEVVVNDAATVAAYGGAQALDAFIQAHRPDGQQRNPNQPQQNMAKDLNAQGVPRFSIGGLPSMKPVIKPTTYRQPGVGVDVGASSAIAATNPIPSMQEAATNSTISKSVNDILFGNKTATTPALVPQPFAVPPVAVPQLRDRSVAAPAPVISPVSLFAPTESIVPPVRQTVTPAPAIATPPPAQQVITSATPPTATTAAATAPAIATPPPAQQVITSATPPTATTAAPAPAIATLPPGQPVPIPTPAAANGPRTYSATNVDEMILNRYMDRLGGMNESERAAEEQRLMQQGIPKTTIDAAIAQSDVGRRSAEGQAVAQYATDAAGRALQQNQFNRTQGLAETEYMNQQTDKAWNDALNSYDPSMPDGLKALQDIYVKNHPGQPAPDMKSLIDQRTLVKQALAGGAQALATNDWNAALLTYDPAMPAGSKALQDLYAQQHPGMPVPDLNVLTEQRKYQQSLQTINVDSLKTKLGADKFDTLKTQMDAGLTYEAYAQNPGQYGNVTLNKTEFDAMRQYSAAGVADWNKQLSGVQLLLSTGGTGNIANAASQLNTMFSGLGIDFSKKITEQNQADFSDGMFSLAQFSTLPGSFEDNKAAMIQAGIFTKLGLSDTQVKSLYEKMQLVSDPLYKATAAIKDSSIQVAFPDAKTPEQIATVRSGLARLSAFGGLKVNSDGSFAIDTDLMTQVLGEGWMTGTSGTSTTKTISYADYSAAATAAGETPKSEAAWRGGGGGAFVPAGSTPLGNKDNAASVVTALAAKGLTTDEESVNAFIKDFGRVPASTDEYKQWDEGRGGVDLWSNAADIFTSTIDTTHPETITPTLQDIYRQYVAGDQRANQYVQTNDSLGTNNVLFGTGIGNMSNPNKTADDHFMVGHSGGTYTINPAVETYVNANVGKIIQTKDGSGYALLGTQTFKTLNNTVTYPVIKAIDLKTGQVVYGRFQGYYSEDAGHETSFGQFLPVDTSKGPGHGWLYT